MKNQDVGDPRADSASEVAAVLAVATRELAHEDARGEAELLLGHVLNRTRAWLYTHADERLGEEPAARFMALVDARKFGQPIAYLIGRRGFHALDLCVGPDVLIPRPETELLVELSLERIAHDADVRIADLGTGSGAIALAIANARPQADVVATDASEAALDIARENASRLGVGNVRFAHGDWCAALGNERFDIIVSNPPYIAEDDPHLARGDLRFEPRSALASGTDGLDAIRRIIDAAPSHLLGAGWLLLEHGAEQGPAVRALLDQRGFSDPHTERDLAGHERVSLAQWRA